VVGLGLFLGSLHLLLRLAFSWRGGQVDGWRVPGPCGFRRVLGMAGAAPMARESMRDCAVPDGAHALSLKRR